MKIDVSVDVKKAMAMLQQVKSSLIPAATVSALNRVATTARSVAVREIRGQTAIKASDVRKYVTVRKASRADMTAEIKARAYAPNLMRYGAREVKQGVSANAWGKRKIYRNAFIGNRGRTVFARVDSDRKSGLRKRVGAHNRKAHTRTRGGTTFSVRAHPVGSGAKAVKQRIKALVGPSVRREFMREKCNTALMQTIKERWSIEFERQLQFRIDRIGAGRGRGPAGPPPTV